MQTHLHFIGIVLITLAMVHVIFPKYFNWKQELKSLSLINRQMMIVHTGFIALTVLLMGLLCIASAAELTQTHLGRIVCLGFGIFWATRLLIQLFGYSSVLWKGKKFETTIHILFLLMWSYFSFIFLAIYIK